MAMTQPLFQISGLTVDSVRKGERRRIVDSLSLKVRPGEIYGLVGESGSGKSISMMTSVGLAADGLHIAGGDVRVLSETIDARSQGRLRANLGKGISLLFQNAKGALNPFLRVERQISRVLKLHGTGARKRVERCRQLLGSVGLDLDDIGSKYAHEVSGGQAQRIALACALATDPKVLVADEPTTALDVTTERDVLRLLSSLCRERGMAVVLVSHNLGLVSEYCERITILHAGHVVESGSTASVFDEPLHPYSKGLIAAIPDVDAPRELIPLGGTVWGGGYETDRCRFAHRCEFATPRCTDGTPQLRGRDDHKVRCVLYDGS